MNSCFYPTAKSIAPTPLRILAIGFLLLTNDLRLAKAEPASPLPGDVFIAITEPARKESTFPAQMQTFVSQLNNTGIQVDRYFAGVGHLYLRLILPAATEAQREDEIAGLQSMPLVQSVISTEVAHMALDSAGLTTYDNLPSIDPIDLAGYHHKHLQLDANLAAPSTGEVIVKYLEPYVHDSSLFTVAQSTIHGLFGGFGSQVSSAFHHGDSYYEVLSVPPVVDRATVFNALLASPYIEYAQPNYLYVPQSVVGTPNAAFLNEDGGWGYSRIQMQNAWNNIVQSNWPTVVIGVIDSGISLVRPISYAYNGNAGHYVLTYSVGPNYNVSPNMWNNPNQNSIIQFGEGQGETGYVDGQYGFNVAAYYGHDSTYQINTSAFGICSPSYSAVQLSTPDDDVTYAGFYGHGTQVAGIIGATVSSNNSNMAGVAYSNARLMSVKAMYQNTTGNPEFPVASDSKSIYAAIEYAIGNVSRPGGAQMNVNAAKVISLATDLASVSTSDGFVAQALSDARSDSGANQPVIVVPAGNGGVNLDATATYPASFNYPNMVVVGASDKNDEVANFGYSLTGNGYSYPQASSFGHWTVDVFAPGVDVWTCDTSDRYVSSNNQYQLGTGYIAGNGIAAEGTSSASAFVTGTLALASAEYPWESGAELAERARFCGDTQSGLNGSSYWSARLDAYNALQPRATLSNLSSRSWVGTGINTSVLGFCVSGSSWKTLAFQALGPGLSGDNVPAPYLSSPQLTLYDNSSQPLVVCTGTTPVLQPQGTRDGLSPTSSGVPTFAQGDTYFMVSVPPGVYSIILQGASGGSGQGLNAVYDITGANESSTMSRLVNLSSRIFVGSVNGTWYQGYLGYTIAGNNGPNRCGVVLESEGPALANQVGGPFVGNVLPIPSFTVGTSAAMAWSNVPTALLNRLQNAEIGAMGGPYVDYALPYQLSQGGTSFVMGSTSSGQGNGGVVLLSAYEY